MPRRKKPSRTGFFCWLSKDGKKFYVTKAGTLRPDRKKAAIVRGAEAVEFTSRAPSNHCAPATAKRTLAVLGGPFVNRRRRGR